MKNLGKHPVLVVTTLNGRETYRNTEERCVYRRTNGTFCVNWLGGHKPATRMTDGSFLVRSDDKTLKPIPVRTIPGFRSMEKVELDA